MNWLKQAVEYQVSLKNHKNSRIVFLSEMRPLPHLLRVPLQRLFYLLGGEFKGFFSTDRSGQFWSVQQLFSIGSYGLFRPFCSPGQCFWNGLEVQILGVFRSQKSQTHTFQANWTQKQATQVSLQQSKTLPGAAKRSKKCIRSKWESFLDCPELPGPIRRKNSLKFPPPNEIKKSLKRDP